MTKHPRGVWIAVGVAIGMMISAMVAIRVDVVLTMAFLGIGYTAAFAAISILLNAEMEKRICDKIDEIKPKNLNRENLISSMKKAVWFLILRNPARIAPPS